jgi:DNA adenine methylase
MKVELSLPLRYPGGKRQLFDFVTKILEQNRLLGCTYIEPYCGGAGLALYLLFKDYVKRIILNDIDRYVYAFWYSVLNRPDEMCELVKKTTITVEEYKKQKEVYKNSDDLFEIGFATLFLNRTNRSGILTGGPIGGYAQNGLYKLDCRFNKKSIIKAIKHIAIFKDKIELYNLDAVEFLANIRTRRIRKKVLFIDPPYYKKGKRLYMNFYKHEDHHRLAEFLTIDFNRTPWLLTYDNAEEIRKMYAKRNVSCMYIEVNYSAATKRHEKELLFYNKLEIPWSTRLS